jgi:hypothetical protein
MQFILCLIWANDRHLKNVDSELDSKRVVGQFHRNKEDGLELGAIQSDCRVYVFIFLETFMLNL